jgi:PAS domain S-box-containing protein
MCWKRRGRALSPATETPLERRARHLAAVAELRQLSLGGAAPEELLDAIVVGAARELGADFAALLEVAPDGDRLLFRAQYGVEKELAPPGAERPTDPSMPAGFVLASDEPVISEDVSDDPRFSPSPLLQKAKTRSMVAARVGPPDRPFGVLGVLSRSSAAFSEGDGRFVQALAETLGVAVDRLRAEAVVRESEVRFRELADSAPVMIWTTDAAGRVTFINRGWLRFTGTTLEEELGDTWTFGVHPDDAQGVLATWTAALKARDPWEHEYRLRQEDGGYRWIVDRGVPRFDGGTFVGYVGTATDIHERKTMEQRLLRVYEREHRVAEILQRSLLPERLPELPGLALAARYLPAGRGAAVGGDWYDALELQDGRIALAVGDVVGHGLRAAAVMGQLRNALRAYALVDSSPARIVGRLRRLVEVGGQEATATLLLLTLDRETGEIAYTSAGHPPPLLLTGEGPRFLEEGRSVPVGTIEPAAFEEARAVLPEGATLLLYTDGLVERRQTPIDASLDHLASTATASMAGNLEGLCDSVLASMLSPAERLDDVALLAVRRDPATVATGVGEQDGAAGMLRASPGERSHIDTRAGGRDPQRRPSRPPG